MLRISDIKLGTDDTRIRFKKESFKTFGCEEC